MRLATEFAASGGWYLGIARVEGTPIAAMAFPRVGDRAYYLYGALRRDEQYKHNYGSHAVMAEMLRTLAADGVKTVDMWGVVEPDDKSRRSGLEGLQRLQAHLRRRARCATRASTTWSPTASGTRTRRFVQSVRSGICPA